MSWHQKITINILLTCSLLLACARAFAQNDIDPVVAVNSQVKEKTISLGTVRAVLGMRLPTWSDGKPIRVYVLADDHSLHVEFTKKVLGIYPHQLRRAWDRLVFSGTGQAPVQLKTEEEMRRKIANTPGAIGYLRRDQINENIRILQIK